MKHPFNNEGATKRLLEEYKKYKTCCRLGIKPDYINESPIRFDCGGFKPYFNILLDDRAGLESAYNSLKTVINYAKTEFNKKRTE